MPVAYILVTLVLFRDVSFSGSFSSYRMQVAYILVTTVLLCDAPFLRVYVHPRRKPGPTDVLRR